MGICEKKKNCFNMDWLPLCQILCQDKLVTLHVIHDSWLTNDEMCKVKYCTIYEIMTGSQVGLEIRGDNFPPDISREVIWSPTFATPWDEEPVIIQTDLE
jgi:hypothetical protein